MDKNKNKSFVKWLEILQQESWQLELLISGFAIFLLASAYDQLDSFEYIPPGFEAPVHIP